MKFSKSTNGFYTEEIHGADIPEDATDEAYWSLTHAQLLEGQSQGKVITSDDSGFPILTDQPGPTEEQLAASVRSERDALLIKADAMINIALDAGKDVTALRTYRQELRDVTLQAGFPTSVDWPKVLS